MDARGSMGPSIGDVATSAHISNLNKNAPAAWKPLALMRADGAATQTAPVVFVSNGTKSHHGWEKDITRRGITLTLVLSGRQSSAPMASPSHLIKVATTVSAMSI